MRIQFGDITFDSEVRELTRHGARLHLSPKAFQLLHILIEARPRAVSKSTLIERLWPNVAVEEANLKNLVAEIRKALGRESNDLRTVHRFGYAFAAAVLRPETTVVGRLFGTESAFAIQPGENLIGRAGDCSIVLPAIGVSRHHARIIASVTDPPQLEDLGSKNGTWLNDCRLTAPAPLASGDRIVLGTATLVYRPFQKDDATVTIETIPPAGPPHDAGSR